ncbi:MAG: DUF2225 domain-containing protein [Lachnospiraceae bacterium]|nr:DUF2225 domain-containing protein [Lachnospiraceae bacterium]
MSIFSGLELFGVKTEEKKDIFKNDDSEMKKRKELEEKAAKEREKNKQVFKEEKDYLLQKEIGCPVCQKKFKTLVVRDAKLRRKEPDYDLRPRFMHIDTLKYDVVSCPYCGYTALSRYFSGLTKGQIMLVKENISKDFRMQDDVLPETYDYATAIMRTKLALYNAVVKRGKTSERAYACLKARWLYRDYIEQKKNDGETDFIELDNMKSEMLEFSKEAYEGLQQAMVQEPFPICGMDQNTLEYLLACLGLELKDYTHAARFLSDVITSKSSDKRLKDRALDVKDKLLAEVNEAKKSKI